MMRYSRGHKTRTRARIVRNASHALRRNGLNGIGVIGLMKSAGLTAGGFYAYFESREALVAEAVTYAMAETASEWRNCARQSPALGEFDAVVDAYLAQQHRDNPARGCPLPAVSADVARSGEKVRSAFTRSLDEILDALAAHIPDETTAEARLRAAGAMATMVGSLVLARACEHELSAFMLEAGKHAARSTAGRPRQRQAVPRSRLQATKTMKGTILND